MSRVQLTKINFLYKKKWLNKGFTLGSKSLNQSCPWPYPQSTTRFGPKKRT